MKNLLRASLLIFAFCCCAYSQTDTNSVCPKLEVFGPAGIVHPGEPMTYTVNLDEKAKNYNIEYIWSISIGEITKGQGTSTIETIQNNLGFSTTATVEIKGLPEGCPNTNSETSSYCYPPSQPIQIDEFSLQSTRIDKARIDNLLTELQNNSNDQGYIIEKFERKTSKAIINQKLKKLRDYIRFRGFDASRVTIVQDLADENKTQFWRVPLGATPPF